MQLIKKKLAEVISNALEEQVSNGQIEGLLQKPKDLSKGDYALPCFTLAKPLRMAPAEISHRLSAKIECPVIDKTEAVAGYLNIFIHRKPYANHILKSILEQKSNYGTGRWGEGKVLAIDFSSPNIAKPFSMGHLRSTVIGHSLALIAEKGGYHVNRFNHIGDWGTQFGKLMAAYKAWGDPKAVEKDPIPELLKLYVQFHEEARVNPDLNNEGRLWFKKLEDHDPQAWKLWTWFREESLKAFSKTYDLLGVSFDSTEGEAFYNDKMPAVTAQLKEMNLLVKSEGAFIVPLGEGVTPCLIQKSDGTSLYATRDLAAAIYRKNHYHFDEAFYVVGHEQSIHFQQVFAVLEKMGFDWAGQLSHVNFGMLLKNGKKMSTRKGEIVRLDEVLEQVIEAAAQNITLKNPGLQNKEEIARSVGVGAVIFNDLKHTPNYDIEFSMEEMLSFEGETGPYLQYTHARACSLLRKGGAVKDANDYNIGESDSEWVIIVKLSEFSGVIYQAFSEHNPSKLARYLLQLAQHFNKYYAQVRILENNESRDERVVLVQSVQTVIEEGLRLLGMEAPMEM